MNNYSYKKHIKSDRDIHPEIHNFKVNMREKGYKDYLEKLYKIENNFFEKSAIKTTECALKD